MIRPHFGHTVSGALIVWEKKLSCGSVTPGESPAARAIESNETSGDFGIGRQVLFQRSRGSKGMIAAHSKRVRGVNVRHREGKRAHTAGEALDASTEVVRSIAVILGFRLTRGLDVIHYLKDFHRRGRLRERFPVRVPVAPHNLPQAHAILSQVATDLRSIVRIVPDARLHLRIVDLDLFSVRVIEILESRVWEVVQ